MRSIAVDIASVYLESALELSKRSFLMSRSSSLSLAPSLSLLSPKSERHHEKGRREREEKRESEGEENHKDSQCVRGESDSESEDTDTHDREEAEDFKIVKEWWKQEYSFLFRLSLLRTKICLLQGNFSLLESVVKEALSHIHLPNNRLDYAKLCHLYVIQKTMQGQYGEAVNEGGKVLILLLDDQHSLPPCSSDLPYHSLYECKEELVRLNEVFTLKYPMLRSNHPNMSDPYLIMGMTVFISLGPPCYRYFQGVFVVLF